MACDGLQFLVRLVQFFPVAVNQAQCKAGFDEVLGVPRSQARHCRQSARCRRPSTKALSPLEGENSNRCLRRSAEALPRTPLASCRRLSPLRYSSIAKAVSVTDVNTTTAKASQRLRVRPAHCVAGTRGSAGTHLGSVPPRPRWACAGSAGAGPGPDPAPPRCLPPAGDTTWPLRSRGGIRRRIPLPHRPSRCRRSHCPDQAFVADVEHGLVVEIRVVWRRHEATIRIVELFDDGAKFLLPVRRASPTRRHAPLRREAGRATRRPVDCGRVASGSGRGLPRRPSARRSLQISVDLVPAWFDRVQTNRPLPRRPRPSSSSGGASAASAFLASLLLPPRRVAAPRGGASAADQRRARACWRIGSWSEIGHVVLEPLDQVGTNASRGRSPPAP